jgi:N-acyl-D-amino-acid deacylase
MNISKRLWLSLGVLLLVALTGTAVAGRASLGGGAVQDFDVLIRGGRVLDGTGVPWRYADVAIRGDRIVEVGRIQASAPAGLVIDARGRYVAPGFIDPHSHAAGGLAQERTAAAAPLLYQGITTAVINPDGGGSADLGAQLAEIRARTPGVNVVPTIGGNPIRSTVMGPREAREPTQAELEEMKGYVRRAMELGAFGFNTGLWGTPGNLTNTAELVALAKVAAEYPGAFYISHIRDESDFNIGLIASIEEVIQISREAGLAGIVTHIKTYGPSMRGASARVIELIDAARAEGVEVWADQYPYNFAGAGMAPNLLPERIQRLDADARRAALTEPESLRRLRPEILANFERAGGAEGLTIVGYDGHPELIGMRIGEVAKLRGVEPVDLAVEMLRTGNTPRLVTFNMQDADVDALMQQPWTMTSTDGGNPVFGEGGTHPRTYGSYARKLRLYALDRGVITMEKAVHSSSGLPATVLGVRDRGFLRPGAYADVLVIDPNAVREVATYADSHAYSEGMEWVFVNGRPAIANGRMTDQRHGRILLRHAQ